MPIKDRCLAMSSRSPRDKTCSPSNTPKRTKTSKPKRNDDWRSKNERKNELESEQKRKTADDIEMIEEPNVKNVGDYEEREP